MTLTPGKPYAVFLSYNSDDREAVEKIAVYLDDQAKLKPWFDQWSLIAGERWMQKLEHGLRDSGSCAIFVGKSGEGPWQKQEVEAALRSQVSQADFRVIPILLPDAPKKPELPMFLEGNTWVEFRHGLEEDDALWRLECGIRGEAPGRGRPKPTAEPEAAVVNPAEPTAAAAATLPAVGVDKAKEPSSVFISYRRQEPDTTLAHALSGALGEAGHRVFIDTGIRWGADWSGADKTIKLFDVENGQLLRTFSGGGDERLKYVSHLLRPYGANI